LHTGARYGHAGVIRILVSAKCNPSEQNKVSLTMNCLLSSQLYSYDKLHDIFTMKGPDGSDDRPNGVHYIPEGKNVLK